MLRSPFYSRAARMGVAVASVGPYRIVEKLGGGAMGDVFLAEDTRLRRRVALKTLAAERSSTPEARRQLIREARAVARINHPNVASIYDVVESPDTVHIVMEYVPGENLSSRLRRGPAAAEAILRIGIQLADALAAAHGMGVIHRDLKPSNVMVTPEGLVKVLDFGLAETPVDWLTGCETPTRDAVSRENWLAGTPPYIPPERFLGEPATMRGDIYSLGVTLFELATGRRPFRGQDMAAIGRAVLSDPVPRIRDINPAVPSSLEAVVSRAMSRKPEDRFGSADDLADALRGAQAALSESTTSGTRWSLPASLRGPARSRGWGAAVLGVAISGAVVAVVVPPPKSTVGAQSTVVAVLPLVNATGDPANDHLGVGIADVLRTTLVRLPGVTMVAGDGGLHSRPGERDLTAMARELGADLVVDGVVQKSGNKVRVTLSLVSPASRRVAWSGSHDGAFDDVLSVQREAATALADALQLTLTPEQRHRVARPATTNVSALADYAQARSFLERSDVDGNLDRSLTLFQSAVAKDPRYAQAHAGLGQAYWRTFEQTRDPAWSDKALLATLEALRLDPDDAAPRHALAVVYAATGRTAEAVEELRQAILRQPSSDEAHSRLGKLLCEQGRCEEGVAELKNAIALRPNYYGHHYELATVYFDHGRYPEATTAAQRVVELQPDSSRGLMLLGVVRYAAGEYDEAIATFERALAVRPDAAVHTNLGNAQLAARRYADAARSFEEAAGLSPLSPFKHRNLADVYERLGHQDRARKSHVRTAELCEAALRKNPRDARIMSLLSFSEAKLGRTNDALRHAEQAVALGPEMADVVYSNAVVLTLAGQTSKGLAVLEQALARGYSHAQARDDANLEPLRNHAGFHRLLGNAKTVAQKGG
jgi:serine/threonine-protein kinase